MKKRKVAANPNEEIGDYMVSPVLSVSPDTSTQEAAQIMESNHVGSLLVKDGGSFVGIITETDLTRKIVAKGLQGKNPSVRDIMTAPAVSATEDTRVEDLCRMMWRLRLHHIPIVQQGQVTGIVSSLDLCRAISDGDIGS